MEPDPAEPFSSNGPKEFDAAYGRRPLLHALVMVLWLAVVALVALSGWSLFHGQFLRAVGALVLGLVAFAIWMALHNWALTHPKPASRP
jgi:hypothetical protein